MKILVTGGAGFIGSHLVDRLVREDYKVVIIDNLSTGKRENLNPRAKFYKEDIQSKKILGILKKEKPQIIFHLAAQINLRKSIKNPIKDAEINIIGSLNLIQSFIHTIPCLNLDKSAFKIIFSSTGGALYGDANIIPTPETYQEEPLSPYGICKLIVEKYLNYYYKVFGLPYVSLRYANVYGPRQNPEGEAGVIGIFCDKMLRKIQPIINGDGNQTRDFIYVNDVVGANILAMKKPRIGVFNIGTAKETKIKTIFNKLKKLTISECKEVYGLAQSGEQQRSCLDSKKVRKELDWQPRYDLDEGLERTVKWFKNIRIK